MSDCIPMILLSRNRAAQVHLLLDSLDQFAPGLFDVTCLWRADTERLADGYGRLAGRHPSVRMVRERRFGPDLGAVMSALPTDGLMTFMIDDAVLTGPVAREEVDSMHAEDEVLGVALRLGRNTTYCHPARVPMRVPSTPDRGGWFTYPVPGAGPGFGYPMALCGDIVPVSVVREAVGRRPAFRVPNELESRISSHVRGRQSAGELPAMMAAYERSRCVSIPVNLVRDVGRTPHGEVFPVGVHALNQRYLSGHRIDLGALNLGEINSAHVELPIGKHWVSDD